MKKTQKILVVDDDANICELLRLYLKKEGYETVICSNGEKALEEFAAEQPDLAILDIMLPKVDGMTVCREIRKTSNMPIITISSSIMGSISFSEAASDCRSTALFRSAMASAASAFSRSDRSAVPFLRLE